MTYELARELKEKGFPQRETGEYIGAEGKECYVPTLSELIDACGDGFRSLSYHTAHTSKQHRRWIAKSGARTGKFLAHSYNKDEAVAKLWLKLKIVSELSLHSVIDLGVKFILSKVDDKNAKDTYTIDQSAATYTIDQSAATITGDQSASTNTDALTQVCFGCKNS